MPRYPDPPDIGEVYEHIGGATHLKDRDGWQNVKCPIHEDSHPSASLSIGEGKFKCFTCGAWGSGWDLLRLHYNFSFREAVKFAREHDLVPSSTASAGRGDGLLRRPSATSGLSGGPRNHSGSGGFKPPWLRIGGSSRP